MNFSNHFNARTYFMKHVEFESKHAFKATNHYTERSTTQRHIHTYSSINYLQIEQRNNINQFRTKHNIPNSVLCAILRAIKTTKKITHFSNLSKIAANLKGIQRLLLTFFLLPSLPLGIHPLITSPFHATSHTMPLYYHRFCCCCCLIRERVRSKCINKKEWFFFSNQISSWTVENLISMESLFIHNSMCSVTTRAKKRNKKKRWESKKEREREEREGENKLQMLIVIFFDYHWETQKHLSRNRFKGTPPSTVSSTRWDDHLVSASLNFIRVVSSNEKTVNDHIYINCILITTKKRTIIFWPMFFSIFYNGWEPSFLFSLFVPCFFIVIWIIFCSLRCLVVFYPIFHSIELISVDCFSRPASLLSGGVKKKSTSKTNTSEIQDTDH